MLSSQPTGDKVALNYVILVYVAQKRTRKETVSCLATSGRIIPLLWRRGTPTGRRRRRATVPTVSTVCVNCEVCFHCSQPCWCKIFWRGFRKTHKTHNQCYKKRILYWPSAACLCIFMHKLTALFFWSHFDVTLWRWMNRAQIALLCFKMLSSDYFLFLSVASCCVYLYWPFRVPSIPTDVLIY
jgi:hypothetical protein